LHAENSTEGESACGHNFRRRFTVLRNTVTDIETTGSSYPGPRPVEHQLHYISQAPTKKKQRNRMKLVLERPCPGQLLAPRIGNDVITVRSI